MLWSKISGRIWLSDISHRRILGATCLVILMALALGAVSLRASTSHKKSVTQLAIIAASPVAADADRRQAIGMLRAIGAPADRRLARLLQTPDSSWRGHYRRFWLWAGTLGSGAQGLLPRVMEPRQCRLLAVNALASIGRITPQTEVALISACRDPALHVRYQATLILGYRASRKPGVVAAIEQAMLDPSLAGLVARGPSYPGSGIYGFEFSSTLPELIQDLDRPLAEARYHAARSLVEWGAKASAAVPSLMDNLKDTNDLVRIASIRALGAVGPPATNALPDLRALLGERDSKSGLELSAVRQAIDQIQGK